METDTIEEAATKAEANTIGNMVITTLCPFTKDRLKREGAEFKDRAHEAVDGKKYA